MIRIDRPAGVDALAPFVEAGVLGPTELEVVTTIARVSGEADPTVLLALALAVRGPLLGHVCIDLATVADTVVVDRSEADEPVELSWPEVDTWRTVVAASSLTRGPEPVAGSRSSFEDDIDIDDEFVVAEPIGRIATPLVLDGSRLYLDRYWRYEQALVQAILDRGSVLAPDAAGAASDDGAGGSADGSVVLDRLFAPPDAARPDRQRAAAESAIAHRLTVIAGGPGTGKTRTVARLLAVLEELARSRGRPLDIRLAAPTGKAAARMTEAIIEQVGQADVSEEVRERLLGTEAVTLHRLLGSDGRGGFRHDADDPLPADVVVVDETSMVSLPLMAHLFAALRPEARIVLVGDPSQLASVEAGAVLGDLVGVAGGSPDDPEVHDRDGDGARRSPLRGHPGIGLVVLDRVHRFEAGSPIASLAGHVRSGDADAVIDLLAGGDARADQLRWVDPDDVGARDGLTAEVVDHARRVITAARSGRADDALAELADHAVLSATRLGPTGVVAWNQEVERRLAADPGFDVAGAWYPGRPVIVTANDYLNQVSNGDVGVTVVHERPQVAFPAGDGIRLLDPSRLDRIETWWAMTIHKSQGSEFGHVVVVLPPPPSPILTRELLYTAVTRARTRVTLLASEPAIRAAIGRPVSRASGLADRLRLATAGPINSAPSADDRRPGPRPESGPDDPQLSLF